MIPETKIKCPLCGKNDFHLYQKNINLLQCESCGIVVDKHIIHDVANEELVKAWFVEDYNQSRSFWVEMFESWANKRTWNRIARFASQKRTKLFEIGVGSGSFLKFVKDKGFDVAGCDLSKSICKHVENTYNITMHYGFISDLPLPFQFDVIVTNHVLEHVNDPLKFLSDLKARLKEDGIIHIAVPNVAAWEARFSGWTSYEPYHLIYFSPRTLRRLVETAGFRVVTLSTHESFSGWFLSILRTLLKTNKKSADLRKSQKKSRSKSWIEHVYSAVMILSGGILFPLRYVQSKLDYGDEIVVIAKKG